MGFWGYVIIRVIRVIRVELKVFDGSDLTLQTMFGLGVLLGVLQLLRYFSYGYGFPCRNRLHSIEKAHVI